MALLKKLVKFGRKVLGKIWRAGRRLFASEKVDKVLGFASLLFPAAAPVVQLIDEFFAPVEAPEDDDIRSFIKELLLKLGMDADKAEDLDNNVEKAWNRLTDVLGRMDMTVEDLKRLAREDRLGLARAMLQFVLREEASKKSLIEKLADDDKSLIDLLNSTSESGKLVTIDRPADDPARVLNHALELTLVQGKLNDGIDDLKALGGYALLGALPGREDAVFVEKLLKEMVEAGEITAEEGSYLRWREDDMLKKRVAAREIRRQLKGATKPIRFFGLDLTSADNAGNLSPTLINLIVESLVAESA